MCEGWPGVRTGAERSLNALAQRLAALPKGTRIDWSDSWSDEDLEKFTAGAVKRLDTEDEP